MIRRPHRKRNTRYTKSNLIADVTTQARSEVREIVEIIFSHLSFAALQNEIIEIPNLGQLKWKQDRYGNPVFQFEADLQLVRDIKTVITHGGNMDE